MTDNVMAAIDLGSNSFHMLVGRADGDHLMVLDQLVEMIRLAAGLDERKYLTPEARQRALDCLSRFGQRIRPLHPQRVRIVGTNTLRKARNARTFLNAAEMLLGHPVEIISGIEEARLIYLGVSHSMDLGSEKCLVVDIGGGSTELIIGERFVPGQLESLYMGCVSMTQQFFANGQISAKQMARAHMHAMMELEPHIFTYRSLGWQNSIGASGTIRAIEKIVTANGWSKEGITRDSLRQLQATLLNAKTIDTLEIEGLKAERKPVILGGFVILQAIFEALGIEQMSVSNGALREGILYDLMGREQTDDTRSGSVANLAKRFVLDQVHAQRVEDMAVSLLKQVPDLFDDLKNATQHLRWAAQLHEIGLSIAHNSYHKHGYYIVANADLLGFSQQDQKLLATLVRTHRRSYSTDIFKELSSPWKGMGKRLAVLLRLAVVLNRSHTPNPIPVPVLSFSKKNIRIQLDKEWLDTHPLTRSDLETEATYLGKAGYILQIDPPFMDTGA